MVKELNFPKNLLSLISSMIGTQEELIKKPKRSRIETNCVAPKRKFDLINICLLIDHIRFPLGNLRLGENIDQIFAFRNV